MADDLIFRLHAKDEDVKGNQLKVSGNEFTFELNHGDQWHDDKNRADPYDRNEICVRTTPCARKWLTDPEEFSYTVRAEWQSARQHAHEGHIILGQFHFVSPLFSLRWAPGSKKQHWTLWADFTTHEENKTTGYFLLGDRIVDFKDNDPLTVNISTQPVANGLDVRVKAIAPGLAASIAQVTCYSELIERNQPKRDKCRFKFGAYRRRKDKCTWSPITVTYEDIRIGSQMIDSTIWDQIAYE